MVKTSNFRQLEHRLNNNKEFLYKYMDLKESNLEKLASMEDRDSQLEFFKNKIIMGGHEQLHFLVDDPNYISLAEDIIDELTFGIGDRMIIPIKRKKAKSKPVARKERKEKSTGFIVKPKKGKSFTRTYSKWNKDQISYLKKNKKVAPKELVKGFREEFKDSPKTDNAIYHRRYKIIQEDKK